MNQTLTEVSRLFTQAFGTQPAIYKAPGRVNLIGEHTDYNDGFVLPAATDKAVYVAIEKRNDNNFHWLAYNLNDSFEGNVNAVVPTQQGWPNYILGVVAQMQKAGFTIGGFNLVVGGDVPTGAGMSSSAAVECATAFALNDMYNLGIDKVTMVKMAQMAEHEFAGVKCGIMDQFASMMGKKGQLLKLDCRSLDYEFVPFAFNDVSVLLFDTKVKHSLASSAYNTRRQECESGVSLIQKHHPEVKNLRDATMQMVETYLQGTGKVYDRCKYVVGEIYRLQAACNDLKNNDLPAFGAKMYETHEGLSKLYEVSCEELDFLVECARAEPDILGARMMGGGFGGCTINLVKTASIEAINQRILDKFFEKFGVMTESYRAAIANGAEKIDL